MKYFIMLGDGMADRATPSLGGKTPLEAADIKTMDRLAALGQTGLVKTVPNEFKPGSDIANLSVLGYDPKKFYSGRSPLEALSLGIDMKKTDLALRLNLVTVSNGVMKDYSAGEISSDEGAELVAALNEELIDSREEFKGFKIYAGVSYRNVLIVENGKDGADLTPPHDISGKPIAGFLPKGANAKLYTLFIEESAKVLKNHAVNLKRRENGLNEATHAWLWGEGRKPLLTSFEEKWGLKGAVISAVDLLKGIAKGASMEAPDVVGANATLSSNSKGKTDKAIERFKNGLDFVYLHIEAPDECSHQGDVFGKIKAIEIVDQALKRVWDYLEESKEDYVIALLPDHATPNDTKTHSNEPVPYVIYKSKKPYKSGLTYNERSAEGGVFLKDGGEIVKSMISLDK
jgi:2,3-bisphosphoglycerate-independent phosphoglycerate mutase